MRLDVGRGLRDVALWRFNSALTLDSPAPAITGDIRVRAFGWQTRRDAPLWRIEQDAPLPFTLLAVSTELKVND